MARPIIVKMVMKDRSGEGGQWVKLESLPVFTFSQNMLPQGLVCRIVVLYFCYRRQKFMTKNTCKFSECISQSKHPQNMLKAHFNDSIWTCWKNVFNVSTLNSPLWYIEIQITNFIPFCLQKQIIIIWNALSDNPVHVTIEQRLGIATTERKSVLCTFYEMVL